MSPVRSPLRQLRPTGSRWVGAALAAGVVAGLGWFVGLGVDRTALGVVAAVALVLLARTAEPVEAWWPDPPALPTRPGWHAVASTQRLLESARTDTGDRDAARTRLDRLPADDPRVGEVRAVVGLRAPGPPTDRPTSPTRPTSRSPR